MSGAGGPGSVMAAEMAEQPARLAALIGRADDLRDRVRAGAPESLAAVAVIARGSSDHAAFYGRYLIEPAAARPLSFVSTSLFTLYDADISYRDVLLVAVSQSGQTPEITDTLARLQATGGSGVAVTNDPESDLAGIAHAVLATGAGPEEAVPATKTVTTQMTALAILAGALGPVPFTSGDLERVPDAIAAVLDDAEPAGTVAAALAGASRVVVVARGFLTGAALEGALKIEETCGILAEGASAADLRHGPIAAVTPDVPVIALDTPGPAHADMADLVATLRDRGTRVFLAAPGDADLPLPAALPEALQPIAAVVRAQQVARALALRLGLDPDRPANLSKVTRT
jgi:glucosamine--fructose-6-phosphate aminotransferase (isomerizing)